MIDGSYGVGFYFSPVGGGLLGMKRTSGGVNFREDGTEGEFRRRWDVDGTLD